MWRNNSTILGGVIANYITQKLEVYSDNFVTKVGEIPVAINAFQVLEFHVKIANSGGIIQVRVDMGALAIDFSGNTKPGADTTINNLQWGEWGGNSSYYVYIDDIILNDTNGTRNNSWPGGLRIIRLAPTGDGATLQWTPTPGPTHSTAVDEVPPVATDKIVAATAGLIDKMVLADCPGDVQTIAAVQPMAFGLKGSSNPPTQLALGLGMTGGNYYTANLPMAVSQAVAKELWEENPDNPGNLFTVAAVNASQLLQKSVA